MLSGQQYPFTEQTDALGRSLTMPYLPLTFTLGTQSIEVNGLLDTGASVNVLPYDLGLQLGAVWEDQTVSIELAGNLAHCSARGLVISASIAHFSPVLLAFAWTQARDVPVILGHMNFFSEFNVCFYQSQLTFEVHPKE
jgi:hypothetical protein